MIKLLILSLSLLVFSCQKQNGTEVKHDHNPVKNKIEVYYTCSMHPQIREPKPGKCPICHMNLTKVEVENIDSGKMVNDKKVSILWRCENYTDVTSTVKDVCPIDGTDMVKVNPNIGIIGQVKLRKAQINHFNPDVFTVTKMKMSKNIRLLGTVLQSEEKESNISARVDGRVERVFIKSEGSYVQKDDPVLSYYSPKLITGGEEYILARKTYISKRTREFKELLGQSEKRLLLWGVRKEQMELWFKQGKVPNEIKIYSNASGIVQKKNAFKGKYFQEGQNFFDLIDLRQVWVEMDVYEQDSALIKIGQKVKLEFTALPGHYFEGNIDFINPILDSRSRTLKVRTTINNKLGKLMPGMVGEGYINVSLKGLPLVIPRTGIVDTGKRKIVWLKKDNYSFFAKNIVTGFESQGYVEIIEGLQEGDEVVIEGNFLLDAQAQLFGGYEDFNK